MRWFCDGIREKPHPRPPPGRALRKLRSGCLEGRTVPVPSADRNIHMPAGYRGRNKLAIAPIPNGTGATAPSSLFLSAGRLPRLKESMSRLANWLPPNTFRAKSRLASRQPVIDRPAASGPTGRSLGSWWAAWGRAGLQALRLWRQRNRYRNELATMGKRDFGDLAVPPSLVRDEFRRWPWQKSSPQWEEIGKTRRDRRHRPSSNEASNRSSAAC